MDLELIKQFIHTIYQWMSSDAAIMILQVIISTIGGIFGGVCGGFVYNKFIVKNTQSSNKNATQINGNPVYNLYNNFDESSLKIIDYIVNQRDEKILFQVEKRIEDKVSTRLEAFQQIFTSQIQKKIINKEELNKLSEKPEFYKLINDTKKIAAQTDNLMDYELLSNLFIEYIDNNKDMIAATNIKKAMDIVVDIDKDILNMITVYYIVKHIRLACGTAIDMLAHSERLILKIGDIKYTATNDIMWYDHLEVLDIIKYEFKPNQIKLVDYLFYNRYSGCVCIGLQKNSKDYFKAIKMLNSVGLGSNMFVDHDLLSGYVRFNVSGSELLHTLPYYDTKNILIQNILFNDKQKKVMKEIWNMYIKDKQLEQIVYKNFQSLFNEFPVLKKFLEWHDNILYLFMIKPIGNLLVNINVRRYEPTINKYDGKTQ